MQTVDDKTVISGLRWYASDQYGLLITASGVGGVGGDFSQTGDSNVIKFGMTNYRNGPQRRHVVAPGTATD